MRSTVSNFESPEKMQEAMKAYGFDVDAPAEVKDPSAPAEKPGESTPEKPADGTAPPSEAGETKPQEPQDGKPAVAAEPKPNGGKPEKRGDFESRRIKLQRQIDTLETNLDLERGSKAKLQTELAEAQAKLAQLQPAEPAKVEGPAKPTRPKRADFEYDDDKFEEAMSTYETQRDTYDEAMRVKAANDAVAANESKRQQENEKAEADRKLREFGDKLTANAKELGLDDYDELEKVVSAMDPVSIGKSAEAAVFRSKNAALLIHYFMKDVVEGEGSESARFARMDGVDQVIAIQDLERTLLGGRAPAKPAADLGTPKDEVKPPVEPARPKPAARPAEPIAPLTGRSAAAKPGLTGLTGRAYREARAAGVNTA